MSFDHGVQLPALAGIKRRFCTDEHLGPLYVALYIAPMCGRVVQASEPGADRERIDLARGYGFSGSVTSENAPGMNPSHFRCWHFADVVHDAEPVRFQG